MGLRVTDATAFVFCRIPVQLCKTLRPEEDIMLGSGFLTLARKLANKLSIRSEVKIS